MSISTVLKATLLLLLFLILVPLYSQPLNDDCSDPKDLGIVPYCNDEVFSNINATASDIGNENEPSCFIDNPPQNDVWFVFSVNSDREYRFAIMGNQNFNQELKNIQAAIYRGGCNTGMIVRNCFVSNENENSLEFLVKDLTIGERYFLRIDNFGGISNSGDFSICIEENNIYNIKDANFSDKCTGILYDSGGANGNYTDNEDYTFTICPEGNISSIQYEFEYYNLNLINEGEFEYDTVPNTNAKTGDFLKLYNGIDTNYSVFLEINGNAEDYFEDNMVFGAGTQYQNCINSPCITLRFVSDDSLNAEGFKFTWNCNSDFCVSSNKPKIKIIENIGNDTIISYIVKNGVEGKLTSINCANKAYGVFENNSEGIGFNKGIILTNGLAQNAIGPNDSGKKSFALKLPGDKDLDSLSVITDGAKWEKSHDACVLEFDIIPYGEEISYKYLFGSEEYHEFVHSRYNDIFALFISGDGVETNPKLTNQRNMAIIPNSGDFVSINTVNGVDNWQYYHSNLLGQNLQYDGMVWDSLGNKHYLIARQKVVPCEAYHLKYAISDRADTIYDSGVFIGDLTDGRPEISLNLDYDFKYLSDNCDIIGGSVDFTLPSALEKKVKFDIELSGTATRDEDYITDIPDFIEFNSGELNKSFKINVVLDDIEEGVEYIILKLVRNFECGRKVLDEISIPIRDALKASINNGLDSIYYCGVDTISLKAKGVKFVHWSPDNYFLNPDSLEVSYTPDHNERIYLEGRLIDTIHDRCFSFDSIYVKNINTEFKIDGDSIRVFCMGNTEQLNIESDLKNGEIKWFPSDFIVGSNTSDTVSVEIDSSDFILYCSVLSNGCNFSDSVNIISTEPPELNIDIAPDHNIHICDTINITADFYTGFNFGDTLIWDIAGTYFNQDEKSIDLIVDRDKMIIEAELKDSIGCSVKKGILINANKGDILFPNAIFPNDVKNSIFKPFNLNSCIKIDKFQIFNRWGEKVFNCTDISCAKNGWDSTINGIEAKPGVYLYIFNYIDVDRKSKSIKGNFILLR